MMELWATVRQAGLSAEPRDRIQIDPLWRALKSSPLFCRICLAVREGNCNSAPTSPGAVMMPQSFVSYLRVSTKKQGQSGLGLEAQREAVVRHVSGVGGEVVREFVEVESGKKDDRPELLKALAFAKRNGAVLIVAKLDRLSRNVRFLSTLMEGGAEFVACDNAHANRFTLHILAAVAEHERELISKRTSAALQAAKARGAKLGSAMPGKWDGREDARLAGALKGNAVSAKVRSAAAREEYADLLPTIYELKAAGRTLREIAAELNARGERTRRGAEFGPSQVMRILERAGK